MVPLSELPALDIGDEVGDNVACLVPGIQEFLSTLQTGSYRAALLFPFHTQEGPQKVMKFPANSPQGP